MKYGARDRCKPVISVFHSSLPVRLIGLLSILLACIVLTVGLDLWESSLKGFSFYLSESLLFSSFWWLFFPFLYGQFSIDSDTKNFTSILLHVLIPILLHVFAYPLLVWLISGMFYYHTFSYQQTLTFGVTQYSILLCVIYTIPYILIKTIHARSSKKAGTNTAEIADHFLTTLLVADGKMKTSIRAIDIMFISANPPYLNIHHQTKRYLLKETLKSMSEKLDNRLFVRIHKSTLVNISLVQSYRSRQNGDYDVVLLDGTTLRLSRNFATAFKFQFAKTTQVAP